VGRCFIPDGDDVWAKPAFAKRMVGRLRLLGALGDVPCDAYIWPTLRSYTREPCVELHMLGSPPIVAAALAAVCASGARLAEPGEFTLRAFLAGRLDLTQAEAVLGIIDAATQRELAVALEQLAGGLAGPLNSLRERLLELLAHLEAGLDFVEEDIEFIARDDLHRELDAIAGELTAIERQMQSRDAADETFRVVLTGPPNAGKSSLLNALAGEDAAIVSDVAGTTRDYIVRAVDLGGIRCQIIDTAGIQAVVGRASNPSLSSTPDFTAQEKSRDLLEHAHLVVACRDATLNVSGQSVDSSTDRLIYVLTKCDLINGPSPRTDCISTSINTGVGLDALKQAIADRLQTFAAADAGIVSGTAARCRDSLRLAGESLASARDAPGDEFIAAELRLALDELGRVVGAVYTDDILDRIFSRFCIGK
jgi:tRNA modification GTPase